MPLTLLLTCNKSFQGNAVSCNTFNSPRANLRYLKYVQCFKGIMQKSNHNVKRLHQMCMHYEVFKLHLWSFVLHGQRTAKSSRVTKAAYVSSVCPCVWVCSKEFRIELSRISPKSRLESKDRVTSGFVCLRQSDIPQLWTRSQYERGPGWEQAVKIITDYCLNPHKAHVPQQRITTAMITVFFGL